MVLSYDGTLLGLYESVVVTMNEEMSLQLIDGHSVLSNMDSCFARIKEKRQLLYAVIVWMGIVFKYKIMGAMIDKPLDEGRRSQYIAIGLKGNIDLHISIPHMIRIQLVNLLY